MVWDTFLANTNFSWWRVRLMAALYFRGTETSSLKWQWNRVCISKYMKTAHSTLNIAENRSFFDLALTLSYILTFWELFGTYRTLYFEKSSAFFRDDGFGISSLSFRMWKRRIRVWVCVGWDWCILNRVHIYIYIYIYNVIYICSFFLQNF